MFEDSTFESAGRIRTRSRRWMIAAFAFNSSILLALILVPLIYPEALPRRLLPFLMAVPVTQPQPVQQRPQPARAVPVTSERQNDQFVAPRQIPTTIFVARSPEPPTGVWIQGLDIGQSTPGNGSDSFPSRPQVRVIHNDVKTSIRVSGEVVEGMALRKTIPIYPPIAKAARQEGKVVLAATISKAGTIENLRVMSGPPMLQQAALDAVQTWRYRPYLLGGEPVEVETTINVIFTLNR